MTKQPTTSEDIVLLRGTAPSKKEEEFYLFEKAPRSDYTYITGEESHLLRRQQILKAHPEVTQLMKATSPISFVLTVAIVLAQLVLAYLLRVLCFEYAGRLMDCLPHRHLRRRRHSGPRLPCAHS